MCDTQTGNLVCTGVVEKQFKLTDDITQILHEHTTGFLKIPDPEIMNQHTLPINVLLFWLKKMAVTRSCTHGQLRLIIIMTGLIPGEYFRWLLFTGFILDIKTENWQRSIPGLISNYLESNTYFQNIITCINRLSVH
jgi:hypothetical protein